jgi:hypothetical protein
MRVVVRDSVASPFGSEAAVMRVVVCGPVGSSLARGLC